MEPLIWTLLIGAVSGWLAGQLFKGYGFGLIGNIIVGIIGSFVGYWLLNSVLKVSLGGGTVGVIATSVIGAIVVLFVAGLFKRA